MKFILSSLPYKRRNGGLEIKQLTHATSPGSGRLKCQSSDFWLKQVLFPINVSILAFPRKSSHHQTKHMLGLPLYTCPSA